MESSPATNLGVLVWRCERRHVCVQKERWSGFGFFGVIQIPQGCRATSPAFADAHRPCVQLASPMTYKCRPCSVTEVTGGAPSLTLL